MHCKNPFRVYKKYTLNSQPSRGEWFNDVGCGKCTWCRMQRRKEWSIRIAHENDYYKDAHFLTLTYSDENLPDNSYGYPTLRKKHLQTFYKRLRKKLKVKIKHYSAGEYGEDYGRPHYHSIIMGNPNTTLYGSNWLDDKGKKKLGTIKIGTVTTDSIMYVTKYVSKKIYGEMAEKHYHGREKEFQIQSQGLGFRHLQEHMDEIISNNYVRYRGKKQAIPRYYQKKILETGSRRQVNEFLKNRIDKKFIREGDEMLEIFEATPDLIRNPQLRLVIEEDRIRKAKQMDLNLKSHQKIKKERKKTWI